MKWIGVGLVVVVAAGCSTVDSKDIRTSGITANYVVTLPEAEDVAQVSATYRVGTLTFVELGDAESVTSSGGGKDVKLKRRHSAGVTDYQGNLDGVVAAGTEITFDLERSQGDDSAPRSTVKLPERVRLTSPPDGTTYSRRAAIPVRVESEPSELPSIVTWAGDCVQTGSLQLEPGRTSITIPARTIRPVTTTPTPSTTSTASTTTCPVNITLTRRTEGTLDDAFKDGHITAETLAVRRITSVP